MSNKKNNPLTNNTGIKMFNPEYSIVGIVIKGGKMIVRLFFPGTGKYEEHESEAPKPR